METKEIKKYNFEKYWWIGSILISLTAAGIWFGLHPYYRIVSIALIILSILCFILKRCWHLITCGIMLLLIVFLWTFGPSGYRYASLIPAGIITMILTLVLLKPRARKVIMILMAAIILTTCIIEIPILVSSKTDSKHNLQYIIVLGAAVYGTEPSVSLKNRLNAAVDYLRKNPETIVVASGGKGEGEEISEAECMYNYLIHKGISKERILMESKSTSTMENLTFSKALIESSGGNCGNIGIVSSSYHLYRAKKMAESIGMNAYGIASDDGYPIYMAGMYIREALAVLKLWTIGGVERESCMAAAYAAVY